MKLTINVCSTHTRYRTFLPQILEQLFSQWEKLPENDRKQVEIVALIDNRSMTVGEKRNRLTTASKGDYISFVDDDDRVSDDYIGQLLKATATGADVITFLVSVSLNGGIPKPCHYSKNYEKDYNTENEYHRLPNHIMCIRRELAVKVPFKEVTFAEDSDFATRLKPLLKTEHQIKATLYHYDWNVRTTEAQEHLRLGIKPTPEVKALCDVIILSNAKTNALKAMTQRAIDTLLASEKPGIFNPIVMEQSQISYSNAQTIWCPNDFNYNKFANSGIRRGSAPWVCVANNDLRFVWSWFHQMMRLKADVMSPKNPGDKRQADILSPQKGYTVGRHFSGWCFVMKRTIWEQIGGLDEDFPFWCADNATVEQLKAISIQPMLVPASQVQHLASVTLKTLDKAEHNELTTAQVRKFNRKYKQNLFKLVI